MSVAVWVWIGVAVLTVVVLAFLAHELTWKSRRLRGDLARLQEVGAGLAGLQSTLTDARGRVATIQGQRGPRAASPTPLLPDPDGTTR